MEVVTVYGTRVVKIPGLVPCPSCRNDNDIERVFRAAYSSDTSADAERLISSEPPVVRCANCERDIVIGTTVSQRIYSVPAQVECCCGALSDLRFARDRNRVRIMARFPWLPFIFCRKCRKRLVLSVVGWESWRNWIFKAMRFIKQAKGAKL